MGGKSLSMPRATTSSERKSTKHRHERHDWEVVKHGKILRDEQNRKTKKYHRSPGRRASIQRQRARGRKKWHVSVRPRWPRNPAGINRASTIRGYNGGLRRGCGTRLPGREERDPGEGSGTAQLLQAVVCLRGTKNYLRVDSEVRASTKDFTSGNPFTPRR